MARILDKLRGGDRRSIGRANEVVSDVISNPSLFESVFGGMQHPDPLVRMRSADVVEKVSGKQPELLQPFKHKLINEIADIEQNEVRWHVALMFSYLSLGMKEKQLVVRKLNEWLDHGTSNIVRVNALQSLVDIGKSDKKLWPAINDKLNKTLSSDSPALRKRAGILLKSAKK